MGEEGTEGPVRSTTLGLAVGVLGEGGGAQMKHIHHLPAHMRSRPGKLPSSL